MLIIVSNIIIDIVRYDMLIIVSNIIIDIVRYIKRKYLKLKTYSN